MRVKNRDERASLFALVDDVQYIARVATEPIKPGYHQLIVWPEEVDDRC